MSDLTEQVTVHEDDIYIKERVALRNILKPKCEHSGVSNSELV
jgi:hypothetical protein